MEQLLIIEDDIGLNQGLSKALKADDRQIISCQKSNVISSWFMLAPPVPFFYFLNCIMLM